MDGWNLTDQLRVCTGVDLRACHRSGHRRDHLEFVRVPDPLCRTAAIAEEAFVSSVRGVGRWGRLLACAVAVAACGSGTGDDGESAGTTANTRPGSLSPTTTTSVRPSTVTTTPPRSRLVVSASGDVNVDPGYIPAFRTHGYDHAWSGLQGVFRTDDVSIVNLECAVSDLGSPEPKEFTFRCDPSALPSMRTAGVDVANLGNNHSLDFGAEALVDSRSRLEQAGIAAVGAGADAAEANEAAVFDRNGWTVAVLGFGGVVPAPDWLATDERPGVADGDTIESMVAAVEAADEDADVVLVTVHWGVELDTEPRPDDRERAEAMIAAGADAIFGHHSHRLQPLEWVDGAPVAWGLGNFVWPNLSPEGARTAIAHVVFEPDGSVNACLLPAIIESPGHPVLQDVYDQAEPCPRTSPGQG